MKDDSKSDDPKQAPPTKVEKEAQGKDAAGAESEPKKPKYEFKIVPADPKNSFDFEDVADK